MQNQLDFDVRIREEFGKNEARRMRVRGEIPGVIYGLGKDTVAVTIDSKKMTELLKSPSGRNRILNLAIDSEQSPALAVDWQVDPVSGALLHVDIQRIDLKEKIRVRVPISLDGVAVGVKEEAGLVEQIRREVEVECLPLEVPGAIEINIAALHIGDSIRVSDLPLSDDYTYLDHPERVVVHVVSPKVEQEETEDVEAIEGEEMPEVEGESGENKEEKERDS